MADEPSSPSDDSDEAWLRNLCRPRQRARELHARKSDEEWLLDLCRDSGNSECKSPEQLEKLLDDGTSPPRWPGLSSSTGGAASREVARVARTLMPSDEDMPGGRDALAMNGASAMPELDGPWSALELLTSALIAVGCPQTPKRQVPAQDTLLVSCDEGDVLWTPVQKCLWLFAMRGMSLGVFTFKIGISLDPRHRWAMYQKEEMWLCMEVMHEGNPEECRQLEMELISKLRNIPGCYNLAPGGEGISAGCAEGVCFCYAVYATAGDGVGVHQAWLARKREFL